MTLADLSKSETPTPLPPAPRRVRLRQRMLGMGMWGGRLFILPHCLVGIGAAIFLLVLLTVTLFGLENSYSATITEVKDASTAKNGNKYEVYYSYNANGRERLDHDTISAAQYQEWTGVTVERKVVHIPIKSFDLGFFHQSHLAGTTLWPMIGFMTLWAGFWNGVLSIFVYVLWIAPLREKNLIRRGTPVVGTVTSAAMIGSGRNSAYAISYSFTDPATLRELTGKMKCRVQPLWNTANPGDSATVVLKPSNPARNTLYEYSIYHCPQANTHLIQ